MSAESRASVGSEVCVEVSDEEKILEVEALQDEIDQLLGQVKAIKAGHFDGSVTVT